MPDPEPRDNRVGEQAEPPPGGAGQSEPDSTQPPTPVAGDDNPVRSRRRRIWRIVKWTLLVLFLLIVLAVGLLFLALANLEYPPIRDWIKDTVADEAGIAIDYRELSVAPFSGVEGAHLVLFTPAPYAQFSPELVHLDKLDVEWDFWPLISGKPDVQSVALRGLTVTVVIDENGRTSFDALGPSSPPAPPKPPKKEPEKVSESAPSYLSELLRRSVPDLAVAKVAIDQITLRLIWIEAGAVIQTATISDLCVRSGLDGGGGKLSANLTVGHCTDADGVALAVEDRPDSAGTMRERHLLAELAISARTPDPSSIELDLHSQLIRQDLLRPGALPERLLRGRMSVAFEPAERRIRVRVDKFDALAGGVVADLRAELRDRPDGAVEPWVETASGGFDLAPLQGLIELFVAPDFDELTVPVGTFKYQVAGLSLDPESGAVAAADVEANMRVPAARIVREGQRTSAEDARLDVTGTLGSSGADKTAEPSSITAILQVAALESGDVGATESQPDSGERIAVSVVSAKVTGSEVILNVDGPTASKGKLAMSGHIDRVLSRLSGQTTEVVDIDIDSQLDSHDYVSGTGEVPFASASFTDPGAGLRAEVETASFSWRLDRLDLAGAEPTQLAATLTMARSDVRDGYQRTRLTDARAVAEATIRDPSHFDADIELPIGRLSVQTTDDIALYARGARFDLEVRDFALSDDDPMRSTGRVAFDSNLAGTTVNASDLRIKGRRVGFSASTALDGSESLSIDGRIPVGWLETRDTASGERLARVERGNLRYRFDRFVLHEDDPLLSRGRIKISGKMPTLALPGTDDEPEVTLDIKTMVADLTMGGTRRRYDANMRVKLDGYTRGGDRRPADILATVTTSADLRTPKIVSSVIVKGPEGPDITAKIDADYRRRKRDLVYGVTLLAERLALIGSILPESIKREHQVDWPALRIDGTSSGRFRDVIAGFGKGTTGFLEPRIVDSPVGKLRGNQDLTLSVTGLDYRSSSQVVIAPDLSARITATEKAGPLHLDASVDADSARVELDGEKYVIAGLVQRVALTSTGAPERGRVDLTWRTNVAKVEQGHIGYPVKDAKFVATGYFDRLSSLRVEELRFVNDAGGTRVEASLALDRLPTGSLVNASVIPGRQALTMSGVWHQKLDPVDLTPAMDEGAPEMRGKVSLPFRVESGDLSAFLVSAQAKLKDMYVNLPDDDIEVVGLNGDIPLIADLSVAPDGTVQVLSGPPVNLYSRTRFFDVHPFLHDDHFLTVERVTYEDETLGPIAGNLRYERDTLALDQLELGFREGAIAGQVMVDYHGGKPRMEFRGTMTGIRPRKGGDILDANAALSFVPSKLALEGRMQIVRLGKGHLRELLDMMDPYRQDVDINRVRLALKAGYPKYVRLRMQDGFLSASIKLGGVTKVVRLGELRGIALEPLLQLYVVPYLPEGTVE